MPELHEGYTETQLKDAFDGVANPDDWRAPICAEVPVLSDTVQHIDLEVIRAAIMFYTGTPAQFELVKHGFYSRWQVTSVGYRNGPCGP